jgi:phytoene dehydrogenase-like protein
MGSITNAMEKATLAFGTTILKNCEVEQILVKDGVAQGVRFKDGRILSCKTIISNADPKRTFLRLVGVDALDQEFAERIRRLQTSVSSLKFHASLRSLPKFERYGTVDEKLLDHIWISPTIDYVKKSWDDANNGRTTRSPILHAQIPTLYDSSMAPSGNHSLSIWVQWAPPHLKEGSWADEETREREGRSLIDTLSEYTEDIEEKIINWTLLTPLDFERRTFLTDGNIRHLDMIPGQMLFSRLGYLTPIGGLYLCGAGTYPGGEVTGAPGHNAAQLVLADLRCESPRGR